MNGQVTLRQEQCLTYLDRLSGKRFGRLMNFNAKLIKDGIKRIVLQRRPLRAFVTSW